MAVSLRERAWSGEGGRVSTRLTTGYTTAMAALGASVFVAPGLGAFSWAAIGACSVGAVLLGSRLNAAPRPVAWWMLGAALAAMAIGDTIYGATTGHRSSAPAAADVCYLAMFPLLTIGLIQMVRTSAVLVDWSRLLDLLVFTCAAGLLAWVCLIAPGLGADGLGSTAKSTMAAYALGDLVTLVTTVRLVVAVRRNAAVILLAAGAAALLTANVWYALAALGAGWRPGGPAEGAYLLFYFCWGAAALQPSMARLTVPAPSRYSQLPIRWAALLGLSLAAPPCVLLIEAVGGQVRDAVVLALTSALMSALVITRLAMALGRHRQAVARERRLREVCGTLVAAGDAAEVSIAVRGAINDLMPSGLAHAVVLAVYDLRSAESTDAVAGIIMRYPLPPAGERRTRLLNTRTLHPDLREHLDPFPTTLSCRLVVHQGDTDDPGLGSLLVAAEHRGLAAIQDSIEVLAAQATLALERIALTDTVNRRSNDEYLRTVTRNSIDVVIIVDADQHIRYASPSLSAILDADVPPFAALRDIVHADDHEQIGRTLRAAQRSTQPGGARDWWHLPRPDGSPSTVEVNCRDLRHDRMVRGYVITLRDVTENDSVTRESIQRALGASPAGQNRKNSHRLFG
jgi:PAS domain S-box-containing protein